MEQQYIASCSKRGPPSRVHERSRRERPIFSSLPFSAAPRSDAPRGSIRATCAQDNARARRFIALAATGCGLGLYARVAFLAHWLRKALCMYNRPFLSTGNAWVNVDNIRILDTMLIVVRKTHARALLINTNEHWKMDLLTADTPQFEPITVYLKWPNTLLICTILDWNIRGSLTTIKSPSQWITIII